MKLRNVSASQVSTFRSCARKWYYGWIEKLRGPTSAAQQRGIDIHAEVEHYLRTGEVRDSAYRIEHEDGHFDVLNYRRYVEALIPYLPPAQHPELIIEHKFTLKLPDNLPPWIGFIDQGWSPENQPPRIYDLKTTSDLRYSKTPAELRENTQLISYAKWVYESGFEDPIDVGHVYLKTEKRKVPLKPKAVSVFVDLDKNHVLERWDEEIEVVREMVQLANAPKAHDVPATGAPHECSAYGGCPHRERCGLTGSVAALISRKGKVLDMGFLQKLRENDKNKAETKAETKTVTPAITKGPAFLNKTKAVPTGILPPDAPSRETPVVAAEEDAVEETVEAAETETPKRRGRPPGSKNSSRKAAANGGGFTLYIDAMPQKGADIEPTLFEDWCSSVITDLNNELEREKGIASFWMLSFAEQKYAIESSMAARLDRLPPAMILSSRAPHAAEAMAVLVPNAALVVRGF